jgi:hypothetical protein
MSNNRYYFDRVTMALDDLLRCRRYCEQMLNLPVGKSFSDERTIYEALFVAFIVSYGRVFTTSNTVDKTFKEAVSNDFGQFRAELISKQGDQYQKLHKRIIEKRDTAIAHSDGSGRNYQHFGDSPLAIGRNPYQPYEHDEVAVALRLVNALIDDIGSEQSNVGKSEFKNQIF